jgi:hypothetical protein
MIAIRSYASNRLIAGPFYADDEAKFLFHLFSSLGSG